MVVCANYATLIVIAVKYCLFNFQRLTPPSAQVAGTITTQGMLNVLSLANDLYNLRVQVCGNCMHFYYYLNKYKFLYYNRTINIKL